MARQFLIGEEWSTSYSAGKLTDEALNIEVLHPSDDVGPVSYDSATTPNPDMIRIVQGTTSGPNVYSNWFNPRNVISWDGRATAAATYSFVDLDIDTNSTLVSGGSVKNMVLDLKFVRKGGLVEEFFHLQVDLAAPANGIVTAAAQDDLVKSAYDAATKPDWLWDTCVIAGATNYPAGGAAPVATNVRFFGQANGSTSTSSGNTFNGDVSKISLIVTSQNDIASTVYTITNETAGNNGVGSYADTKDFEEKMRGIMYGYYNRRSLPNTPDLATKVGSTYDMLSIVATKDGSSASGQIHGVDNLDEIVIASKSASLTLFGNASSFVVNLNTLFPNLPSITAL
tara:strand:- start:10696 stop:11718 length:1023 start_codon:yes stop_codon:yes gene_type:complete